MITTRPSGCSTWLGYQRPCGIEGCSVQVSLKGLKV